MQGAVREIALELVRADGSRLPVLVNSVLRRDDGGPAARRSAPRSSTRPTAGATSASCCRRGQTRARAAARARSTHVAEGVVLLDEDGAVVVVNAAARRLFELAEAEAVGSVLSELVPEWAGIADRVPVGRTGVAVEPVVVPLLVGGADALARGVGRGGCERDRVHAARRDE